MYNCIFTSHCMEVFCDKSCPTLAETSYLLERNNISIDSDVFRASDEKIAESLRILNQCDKRLGAVVSLDTISTADLLTYCAICQNWRGSKLHCVVYNLRYSKYLDLTKKSWSMKSEPDELEYMHIWAESCKVLIVSNMDYINFGDFESQILLNLLQTRQSNRLTTIFVIPNIQNLLSNKSSSFFNMLKSKLSEAIKVAAK